MWFEIQDVLKKLLKVTYGNISPYKDIQVRSISLIVLDSSPISIQMWTSTLRRP